MDDCKMCAGKTAIQAESIRDGVSYCVECGSVAATHIVTTDEFLEERIASLEADTRLLLSMLRDLTARLSAIEATREGGE